MSKVFTITEGLENLGALRTGGQGSVYKGRRTGTIYTAIKMLPTPIHAESEDDRNYRNFQSEVAKLQKVNEQPSPHVVKIMSWGLTESGSFPFIEMEYIEGPDLSELLQAPHEPLFTLKEILKIADQLAAALAHCHRVGVKHGDLKSNNVKYNVHSGNYVLLDFGLAVLSDEQRRSSLRHAGAIEFMAPEQHELGQLLLQTDVYSYGVILYELLTGEVPFPLPQGAGAETSRNQVLLAHLEGQVPDAIAKRSQSLPQSWGESKRQQEMQVPQWLLEVIYRCLEKAPEARYASGVALQEAIVSGSLRAAEGWGKTSPIAQALSADVLQRENEQLQQQLLQLQEEQYNRPLSEGVEDESKVSLSKPLFIIMVTLLVLFMGFSVYSAFFKRTAQPVESENMPDTTQTTPSNTDNQVQEGNYVPMTDSVNTTRKKQVADSVRKSIDSTISAQRKAEAKKAAAKDSIDNLKPDTTVKPEEPM
ncbi:serine/threonine protein kinase [Mucilaginibacter robiniae]|uniref:Serine/threonine protein kinase n=1 Tax=Mucilaginibacter robiniae TaxID=2728022 RepID=A0A7L5E236_9SPHI|nr:serine/threonine-protein kinase [Mucilaginibacter robiniae]QJD94873.1 serine/threonine protein kinase [Mucilaginibacter robiniae]